MIHAVLDANVLTSGFAGARQPESPPGELLRHWRAGMFVVVTSDHLRTEVLQTLRQPYFRRRLSPAQQSRAAALLRYQAEQPITTQVAGVATHPEDDLVLATAVSAQVDYLVTGDAKLQRLESYAGVRIVSPVVFLAILQREEGSEASESTRRRRRRPEQACKRSKPSKVAQ